MSAVAADDRPFDFTPVADERPATDTHPRSQHRRHRLDSSSSSELLGLGEPLGISAEATAYKRRIGYWLLWRAGPARGPALYLAIDSRDLNRSHLFELTASGEHTGTGPSGAVHTRFRAWKEDLLGR